MIKAVIFDYGGVVAGKVTDFYVTNEKGLRIKGEPCLEQISQRLGLPCSDLLLEIDSQIPQLQRAEIEEKAVWEKIALTRKLTLPVDYNNLLGERYLEVYQENLEVVALISRLKKQGTLVGLLSNTIKTHTDINERYNRFEKFDFVILSHQVGFRKPEEEIYKEALQSAKKYDITPSECVYIDDVLANLEPAQKLGMHSINFRNGENEVTSLKQSLIYLGLKL